MYSPIIIARIALNDRASFDVRAEYYSDEHSIIIASETANGFKTTGVSTNFDYTLNDNALWRIELRNLNSKDPVFSKDGVASKNNTFVTTSLCVKF